MNLIATAAKEISDFMAEKGWKFCLIGGLAVEKWGEPRTTLDADFTLLAGLGREEEFIRPILGRFESRIPNAEEFAITNRVLLIKASNGTSVDISLGALPFEIEMIDRATSVQLAEQIEVSCCTAEDLFVMKVFAGRPRDLIDAQSIVDRQNTLDVEYILSRLRELSAIYETTEPLDRAQNIIGNKP